MMTDSTHTRREYISREDEGGKRGAAFFHPPAVRICFQFVGLPRAFLSYATFLLLGPSSKGRRRASLNANAPQITNISKAFLVIILKGNRNLLKNGATAPGFFALFSVLRQVNMPRQLFCPSIVDLFVTVIKRFLFLLENYIKEEKKWLDLF